MEKLIPVINKLQDVLNAVGSDEIDLPQIVVIGSQSSGKSSVLESLVGRDFLPRGSGIVTRRPLVLQLNNMPFSEMDEADSSSLGAAPSSDKAKEWGEFLHMPRKMFTNFNEIRAEIQHETDRIAGNNKGVVATPITLKIYSPHVLNLTLVDLPGMTKVPVGDQPSNIEEQIREMVMHYISKPSAIILAVTAANTDLANSDALQMAKRVDPKGDRTIGVLTKLDLMDKGTDAVEVLQGKLLPLKLGYIAVINRSQQDIISDKPMAAALKAEEEFFASSQVYKSLHGQCGTKFLATTLNKTLMYHIKSKLPELRSKISKSYEDAVQELASFGTIPTGVHQERNFIFDMINEFHRGYVETVDGKVQKGSKINAELIGGARISYVFSEIFTPELMRIDPLEGMTPKQILIALRNATGPRKALFIPETAFESRVKRQISRLEAPVLQCVDNVFAELQRIVAGLENSKLARFERLREAIMTQAEAFLNSCRAPCKQMITDLLAIENAYINTSHPDFVSAIQQLQIIQNEHFQQQQQLQQQQQQQQSASQPAAGSKSSPAKPSIATSSVPSNNQPIQTMAELMQKAKFADEAFTPKEKQEVKAVLHLLVEYFKIVRTNIQDTVPKAIMQLLVNESKKLDKHLLLTILDHESSSDLLMESSECANRRKNCERTVATLEKAKQILSTVDHHIA